MTVSELGNIVWTWWNGRNRITNIILSETKVVQYCKLAYANVIVNKFKKEGNSFYLFSSNILSKEFLLPEIPECDLGGMRFVDMTNTPTISLPFNQDLINVQPINKAGQVCGCKKIRMLQSAGEASFYCGKGGSAYGYKVANGIEIYNAPLCVEKVRVQAVYDDMKLNVPQDLLFDVSRIVLELVFEIKKYPQRKIDDQSNELLEMLKEQKGQVESLP